AAPHHAEARCLLSTPRKAPRILLADPGCWVCRGSTEAPPGRADARSELCCASSRGSATATMAAHHSSPPEPAAMPIKYGQIGVGHAHASKFSVYQQSEDYEVVGVAEPNEELRRAVQKSDTYKDVR